MRIIPVNFNKEQSNVRTLQDATGKNGSHIAINPNKFDKLITALRTAVDNDGTLGKEATLTRMYSTPLG